MNNTHRAWESLPVELLNIILQLASTQQSKVKSCNVALVCKAWMDTAQAVAYSNITIKIFSQFEKFHNTIVQNPRLGIKVKTLNLQFDTSELQQKDKVEVPNLLTSLLTTSLPNLEVLEKKDLQKCVPTLHTILNSQLKKLRKFTHLLSSTEKNEVANYVKCALLMTDRIENISIMLSSQMFKSISIQYQRLYDSLCQFKNLVRLDLSMETDDGTQPLEYIVEACRSLKYIRFYLLIREYKNRPTNSEAQEISRYTPRSSIESLELKIIRSDDYNLLLYVMHKFPQLKDLSLLLQKDTPVTDAHLVNQLLEYISTIDSYSVVGLSVNQNNLMETIGEIWIKTSELGSENLHFAYSDSYSEDTNSSLRFTNKKKVDDEERWTVLKYSANVDFQWSSYMDFIRKYGIYINSLRFGARFSGNHLGSRVLPGYFFPQTLTYCPHIARLQLYGCELTQFIYSDISLNKTFSINEVSFVGCAITHGVLELLSVLLHNINQLCLLENSNRYLEDMFRDEELADYAHLTIIMPHTNINRVVLLVNGSTENVLVKVRTMPDDTCYYYQLAGTWMNYWIKLSTEQEFAAEDDYYHIYVRCSMKPEIDYKLHTYVTED